MVENNIISQKLELLNSISTFGIIGKIITEETYIKLFIFIIYFHRLVGKSYGIR